jgi:predicted dithiol-disulfide oxidoreductase (DUF899 family)
MIGITRNAIFDYYKELSINETPMLNPDLVTVKGAPWKPQGDTLWADGFNGICDHPTSRVAFVLSSPDPAGAQKKFATGRGWRFPMVSHAGTTFAADNGYRLASGGWLPGITAFRTEGIRVLRVSHASTSPRNDFCRPRRAAGW